MKTLLYAIGLSSAIAIAPYAIAEPSTTTTETVVTTTAADVAAPPVVAAASPAAESTTTPAATEEAKVPSPDHGDTAWMLISTALVLLMTLPGLALFYSGMVRRKNVLGTLMHSMAAAVVATLVWVIVGYSLAFGNASGSIDAFIGGFNKVMMNGIGVNTLWTDAGGAAYTIPEILFAMFQLTFAIITVAILAGSLAERVKFSSFLVFIAIWVVVVYSPIAHWVWNAKGWLFGQGALDFAGGTVVHINSGVAGLVAAYVLGKRVGYGKEAMAPHNLVLTMVGAGMLWVGWFGFNAGSWLAADGRAAMALAVTQVCAAAAAMAWIIVERLVRGKASLLGAASGAIAGLVVITPAAGYVTVGGALIMGLMGGVICFYSVNYLKRLLKVDDSLDAFGLHAVGGIVGAILTAFFATETITGGVPAVLPLGKQLIVQLEGVGATVVYSAVATFIIVKLIDITLGFRVDNEAEREGLDLSQHGERVDA